MTKQQSGAITSSVEFFDVRCLHCNIPFLSMNSKTDLFVSII